MMKKLRNHIPIGAPARREPADETESRMRVSLGFLPAWFHKRCGVSFTREWHFDPYYRYHSLKKMKQKLCQCFPTVEYWDEDYKDDLATISGCLGAYVIPAVFGFSLDYAEDRWPVISKSNSRLTIEDINDLNPEKVLSGSFVEKLLEQMDVIKREWGKIHGYLNWQGVLNNAFNLRGQKIFMDMIERPEFVHQFFSLITEVMIRLSKIVQQKQRESGFYINHFCVSNCTLNMISPDHYKQFVYPYDRKIANNFQRFGVHTCNWDATPYFEVLSELPRLGYIDMGIMSDLEKAREFFRKARRAVLYSPVNLEDYSLSKIKEDMTKIHKNFAPCDVVMADIKDTTPDYRVRALLEICRRLEND